MNRSIARMGMEYWSKHDSKSFEDYMFKSFDSKEYLKCFIQIFPNFWNSEIVGIIKEEDYKYIKETINLDPEIIIKIILQHYPNFNNFQKD